MNIEPTTPPVKNPPEQFIGDVWVDTIAAPHESDQRMVVASVKFAYGARTAWHCHARGQYLRVTAGVAWFGDRDGNVIEVHAGQTLYTPPGTGPLARGGRRLSDGAPRDARERGRPHHDHDPEGARQRRRLPRPCNGGEP